MATFTAIGPALDVNGPLPVAPAYRLLSVPGVRIDGSDRWLNGVNVWGYPCDTPDTWDPCNDPAETTKSASSDQPVPRFDSFQAYLPITCIMGQLGPPDEFAQRAVQVLDATVSMPIESALSQGTGIATNPFFGDVNMAVINGGASVPVATALAYLENAIAATGRQGLIHLTPAAAAALGYSYLDTDGQTAHVLGTGSPVSIGHGYVGAQPTMYGAAAAGQSWIFASGPVQVYMTETEIIDTTKQSLDRSDNTLTFRAEVGVLAMWDTCLQVGVLADWSP